VYIQKYPSHCCTYLASCISVCLLQKLFSFFLYTILYTVFNNMSHMITYSHFPPFLLYFFVTYISYPHMNLFFMTLLSQIFIFSSKFYLNVLPICLICFVITPSRFCFLRPLKAICVLVYLNKPNKQLCSTDK
jgi:hypothetical protein